MSFHQVCTLTRVDDSYWPKHVVGWSCKSGHPFQFVTLKDGARSWQFAYATPISDSGHIEAKKFIALGKAA